MAVRNKNPSRASCGDCGKPILWTTTEAGKSQPVDSDPMASGPVLVHWEGRRARSRVYRPDDDDSPPPYGHERRHVPHAATCPQATGGQTFLLEDRAGNLVNLDEARSRRRRQPS
jgi:hypothetical protein